MWLRKNKDTKSIGILTDSFVRGENIYLSAAFLAIVILVTMESLGAIFNLMELNMLIFTVLILFVSVNGKIDGPEEEGIDTSKLGIGFGSTCVFYIMMLSLQMQNSFSRDAAYKLIICSVFMEATSLFLFSFPSKKEKNTRRTSIKFFLMSAVMVLVNFQHFTGSIVMHNGNEFTNLKSIVMYALTAYYLVSTINAFRKKVIIECKGLLNSFLILTSVSNLYMLFFYDYMHIAALIMMMVKLTAYVILYKFIVHENMKAPMRKVYMDMIDTQNCLKIKNRTLQETVERLEKQIISRKRYERKLKYAEEKYQKIVNNSPETIYIQDGEKIIFMNKAARSFFAVENSTQLYTMSILDIVDEKNIDTIKERLRKTQREKKDLGPIEIQFKCLDGTRKILEVADTHINIDGKGVTLSIGRDITNKKLLEEDRKKLNEAMEYEKIRSNFFSNISHELRTPINIIYSSLQVIDLCRRTGLNTDEYGKYYSAMKKNCLRLTRIINNIIDITKMDSGYYVPHYRYVDIVSAVEDTTQIVNEYIKNENIDLVFDTDVEEKRMYIDKDLIIRMLLNILSNSVKFTHGLGNIEVDLKNRENGIEIKVKDDGMGVAEEYIDMIFDKFRQVDKTLRRGQEGSGLGLAIVKSIVDLHEGKVSMQSQIGKGCTITVFLPDRMAETCCNEAAATIYEDSTYMDKMEIVMLEFSDIYF